MIDAEAGRLRVQGHRRAKRVGCCRPPLANNIYRTPHPYILKLEKQSVEDSNSVSAHLIRDGGEGGAVMAQRLVVVVVVVALCRGGGSKSPAHPLFKS